MFVVTSISSRLKDRYRAPINTQTTASIPASTRHQLAEEIETTIYASSSYERELNQSPPPHISSSPTSSPSATTPASPTPISTLPSSSSHTHVGLSSPSKSGRWKRGNKRDEQLIRELDVTIEETEKALEKMKESENFLDLRIRRYRFLLDQQSVRLCSRHLMEGNDHIVVAEGVGGGASFSSSNSNVFVDSGADDNNIQQNNHDDSANNSQNHDMNNNHVQPYAIDVEKEAEIKKQFHQQAANEQKLKAILDVQRNILIEIEIMRRKLMDLQSKRDGILRKREECEEFLIASAQLDMNKMNTDAVDVEHQHLCEEQHHVNGDGSDVHQDNHFITPQDAVSLEMKELKLNECDSGYRRPSVNSIL